ncbi:uncharacterized protein LAESUDRAFT_730513 [Laetiporus sulphureus 93-53]|uniref:Uncharacterized protein n=1 Tax=Laetiporus sulphureus 93-53 TaxID=1314785 RepID=A0A165C4C8_9APHY|nr:uncharacterized protein LAESUDRAFT_730513 [Laetiporus sulphureus 93-53]KZT02183.1 hypothetical protein LAESUDRAFT_730513 [Laetiporus sulphureus 93-53]
MKAYDILLCGDVPWCARVAHASSANLCQRIVGNLASLASLIISLFLTNFLQIIETWFTCVEVREE